MSKDNGLITSGYFDDVEQFGGTKPLPDKPIYTNPVLNERRSTHGDWELQATIHDTMLHQAQCAPNWNELHAGQRMALNIILMKVSRILAGNPNEVDHWRDISGYAGLEEKRLSK